MIEFLDLNKVNEKILRILISLIPHKKTRRTLRKKYIKTNVIGNPNVSACFKAMSAKQNTCLRNVKNIKTIALGSSHIDYAFYPKHYSKSSYNLGSNSQDLENVYFLYEYYAKKLPNLKNIIIGISVFSNGFLLRKTHMSFLCDIFKSLYDFTYEDYPSDPDNFLMCNRLKKKKSIKNNNGYVYPKPFFDNMPIKDRAASHLKGNQRQPNQLHYLDKLIDEAEKNNHKITFVLMPAKLSYKDNLPKKEELFKEILQMALNNNISVVDFYNSDLFNDNDFCDADHLNQNGAEKFSKKLKDLIND